MDEQRRQILQMLAEGTITAEEAERLIDAVERDQDQPDPPAKAATPRPRYLRVLVEDTSPAEGESRVNIRVPLKLLRAGVKLASLIPPRAVERINTELDKTGVPLDIGQLKPDDLEELIDQIDDVIVNVDDHESKVRVFCE